MEDVEIKKLITDSLKPLSDQLAPLVKGIKDLTDNQKVIVDTMAADKTKAEAAVADAARATEAKKVADAADAAKKGTETAAPLTAEAIAQLVKDGITGALTERDKATQSTAARDKFIAEKLKDVPAVYAGKLGSDPAKWESEAVALRGELKADLAKIPGVSIKDVAGGDAGGSTASSATAAEKITQFKAAGLSDGEADFAATLVVPK